VRVAVFLEMYTTNLLTPTVPILSPMSIDFQFHVSTSTRPINLHDFFLYCPTICNEMLFVSIKKASDLYAHSLTQVHVV